ncbi:PREDICTED: long-chain fatty acid transport protein 4 isoform X2 [Ceratosolen solmsi marchali]|nr:PREDICTED: long-chain fatty acid transport protein 4 isoform X2 [Ceratosolen solmsi marchali]XP_011494915.1 PREDICTED: long-chain fatty acid transport protein 4 isoform X2 [Ceratosolen solmsi marchali]
MSSISNENKLSNALTTQINYNNIDQDVERGEAKDITSHIVGRPSVGILGATSVVSLDCETVAVAPGGRGDSISSSSSIRRWTVVTRLLRCLLLAMFLLAGLLAALTALWLYMGSLFIVQLCLVAIVAYFVAGGRLRWFYIAFKTAPRDIKAICRYSRLLWAIKDHEKKHRSVADVFQQHVAHNPNKPCLIFEDQEWTFQQIEDYSNKVAYVFKTHGYKKGDAIALLLENRPEYIAIWLGLSKLGIITPLINTNLRKSSLLHSITVAECQALIYGFDLAEAVKDIAPSLDSKLSLYRLSDDVNTPKDELEAKELGHFLADAPSMPPVVKDKGCYSDKLMYIYTSGTTGLPKAAVITNSRFMFIASGIYYLAGFHNSDRFYTPLPLYHTAGGVMSVGQSLLHGATTVIRKKFSASSYFSDCIKYNCTVSQYIGEMCRYILAVPSSPEDIKHNIRVIFGNGLRPQIWHEFVTRFEIPEVCEFYGATEGNANIINIDNTIGAIGFVSRILPAIYPISIIKINADGEPIRNSKGLCQVCEPNEPGVFIGKIIPHNPSRAFLGYVDKKASKTKIVHDVFSKGDSAFLSAWNNTILSILARNGQVVNKLGNKNNRVKKQNFCRSQHKPLKNGDILVADELGYLYFKDRTGDTFRWKGENVSTSEIEGIISNLINYRDCIVYGVEVYGIEGRAGMAAIYDVHGSLNIEKLATDIKEQLPVYARPQFIRILTNLDLTGTFKLKKKDLQIDSYDPRIIRDKLYYMDPKAGYQLITPDVYDQIQTGRIRF